MSSLHVVHSLEGLAACRRRCSEGDAVLLVGDAVYASDLGPRDHALKEDVLVRGWHTEAKQVDYAGFVDLTAAHSPIVSWP